MKLPVNRQAIHYEIDSHDLIVFVDDSWSVFASQNSAQELTESSTVGKPIWAFLAGDEVRHLYEMLFAAVRSRGAGIVVPFRCDSPTHRRFMELEVLPLADGELSIISTTIAEEERPYVDLLGPNERDPDWFLTVCSWCKQVQLDDEEWVEVEDAVRELELFALTLLPSLTHGICTGCATKMKDEIRNRHTIQ